MLAVLAPLFLMGIASECFIFDIIDFISQRWSDHTADLFDVYMNAPSRNHHFKEPIHKHVREALEKLPAAALSDPSKPLASTEEILAALAEAGAKEKDSALRAIFDLLTGLADDQLNDCSTYLIEVIKSILFQCRAKKLSPQLVVIIKHFLHRYGRQRVELCLRSIDVEREDHDGREAAETLTEFFMAARSENKRDEETLYRMLDSIQLDRSKFDMYAMSAYAKQKLAAAEANVNRNPMGQIRLFLNQKCAQLFSHLGTAFDIVNLARVLGSPLQSHSLKLLRLNELSRLCLSWQKNPAYRIDDNFHRQLDSLVGLIRPAPSDGEQ